VLDSLGDGMVQKGLLRLYAITKHHGWYWGAGFKREDGMHFELSARKLNELLAIKGPTLKLFLAGK